MTTHAHSILYLYILLTCGMSTQTMPLAHADDLACTFTVSCYTTNVLPDEFLFFRASVSNSGSANLRVVTNLERLGDAQIVVAPTNEPATVTSNRMMEMTRVWLRASTTAAARVLAPGEAVHLVFPAGVYLPADGRALRSSRFGLVASSNFWVWAPDLGLHDLPVALSNCPAVFTGVWYHTIGGQVARTNMVKVREAQIDGEIWHFLEDGVRMWRIPQDTPYEISLNQTSGVASVHVFGEPEMEAAVDCRHWEVLSGDVTLVPHAAYVH